MIDRPVPRYLGPLAMGLYFPMALAMVRVLWRDEEISLAREGREIYNRLRADTPARAEGIARAAPLMFIASDGNDEDAAFNHSTPAKS